MHRDKQQECVLTHGIQLEITRLRYSSKHNLNICQFNYQAIIQLDDQAIHDQVNTRSREYTIRRIHDQANTRSGGFLQKAHIRKARTAKRHESM